VTREEHDKYVNDVHGLMARFTKDRLEDLTLTDEEAMALAELDPKYMDLANRLLSRFTPEHPEYDYMHLVMEKAMAVFALDIIRVSEEAYKLGVEAAL